jgi:hypothetical protein
MNVADVLAKLSTLIAFSGTKARGPLDYSYCSSGGTTYLLSAEYLMHGYDRPVVAGYLGERLWKCSERATEKRNALIAAYLLAMSIGRNNVTLLLLSAASIVSQSLHDVKLLHALFDRVIVIGKDGDAATPDALASETPLAKVSVLVAVGCTPAEINSLFKGKDLPECGVVIFRKGEAVEPLVRRLAVRAVACDNLGVDLGDGSAMGLYWGLAE